MLSADAEGSPNGTVSTREKRVEGPTPAAIVQVLRVAYCVNRRIYWSGASPIDIVGEIVGEAKMALDTRSGWATVLVRSGVFTHSPGSFGGVGHRRDEVELCVLGQRLARRGPVRSRGVEGAHHRIPHSDGTGDESAWLD